MSEPDQRQNDSPLVGERGTTTISDGVVSRIAGMSAQEVEGVHMGGTASRTAGGLLGGVTGSESQTRGVSVEVGKVETAIDLKMGIEYGKNILESVEEVRRRITDRVQSITGLRVTELNVTIADITFPEKEQRRSPGSGDGASTRSLESADDTDTGPEARAVPGSERETTEVEPRSRTHTEGASGPVPEEEVRVEGRPLDGDEIAELRPEGTTSEQSPEQRPASAETETGETETSAETQTGEAEADETETEAEARRRRRAEERARRRRQSEGSDEG